MRQKKVGMAIFFSGFLVVVGGLEEGKNVMLFFHL